MADNVLIKLVQTIPAVKNEELIRVTTLTMLENTDKIYSYIVFKKDDTFVIQCNISQTERYNTLTVDDVVNDIINIILNYEEINNDILAKGVLGYKQPPLELMLEAYDPLVNKLAMQQSEHWKQYERCDLCQICRMVMINLYRKGYYLHKELIRKCFINELLLEMRNDKYKPTVMSLDDVFYKPITSGSEDLTFADIIKDTSEELVEQEKRISEAEMLIFNELKDIIVDLIGIRQWNEFYRDYVNKHTTAWSRKTLMKIKNHLATLGLTRGKFNDKYYK